MPTAEKIAKVEELSQKLKEASGVYLTDFTGLNVEEMNELRKTLRQASVQYQVVKNTLARLSVQAAGCEELLEYLDGPTAMAFGVDDPAAPARLLKEFQKKNDKLKFKACLLDGVLIGAEGIDEIANLPTKDVLLVQLVTALNHPIQSLVSSLHAVLANFVTVLDEVRKKKESEAE